jgi:hypothetical protein
VTAVRISTNYGQNVDTVDFLMRQWRWSAKDTHLRDRIPDEVSIYKSAISSKYGLQGSAGRH